MGANCIRQEIEALSELIERQRRLVPVCAADHEAVEQTYAALDKLDSVIGREIQILVTGQFCSGKTTLLNALLREELLFTSVVPSTAIPTELHYGAERRAIIYPRKGAWRGGDRPFEIALSPKELREYCGWNQDDSGHPTNSLFERAEIFIPNPVLEQAATFIEVSATAFDPNYHSQCKFYEYASHTDIVLYVMNGTGPFSYYDRECLERLRMLLGPSMPILFVVTFFDVIPPEEKQKLVDYVCRIALPYAADLGIDAIHFVDSWVALKAIETSDRVLLEQSGLNRLEFYLINELCLKKNYEKIVGIIRQMEQVNMVLSAQIETQYDVDVPNDIRTSDAFRERSEELLGAQMQIELIRQKLSNLLGHCE